MAVHHPAPELLAAFASGGLTLGRALCIAAHLEYCSDCRTNVHRLNNLGGHLFASLAPEPGPDSTIKARVLAELDTQRPVTQRPPQLRESGVPHCLQKLVGGDYSGVRWRSMTPSIKSFTLCRDEQNAVVSLLKIMPGAQVGHHGHLGEEFTLVLQGSFSDERSLYQKGDFAVCDGEDRHNPIASKDAACICLTVQDAPIQFTGRLARVLNPLLRASYRMG
jgi:putative transcriptional regulator